VTEFKKKNFLIILISPSGGGKSTIGKMIVRDRSNIEYSISYTTRRPRGMEKDGIDYHFISESAFKQKIDSEDFLEYAFVHGNFYGTSRSYIEKKLKSSKHVLLDIDIRGAKQILESGVEATTIFILPPSKEILKERLIKRGTDSEDIIEERLHNAVHEIKQIKRFQYLIINDDLQTAYNDVLNIIKAEENRTQRFINIEKTFYGGVFGK